MDHFRWHLSPTYLAHLFKAVAKQHHKPLIPVLRPLLPEDAVVFDVGAHAGQYSKLFAKLVPEGRVFSFEPGSYARSILRIAILLNRLENVTIVPIALGDRAGVETLTLPVKRPGSYGFGLAHLGREERWPNSRREIVPQATLDEVVAALDLDRLDFIKADIEGWEMRLVRGGREALRRFRPVLLLELNEGQLARAGDSLSEAFETLAGIGYRPRLLDEAREFHDVAEPCTGDIWWFPAGSGPRS
jgi:FkbM family methyltransferase